MRGLPQKQNARRADKIKLCGHLRRYKKIVKKTYIICSEFIYAIIQKYNGNFENAKNDLMNEIIRTKKKLHVERYATYEYMDVRVFKAVERRKHDELFPYVQKAMMTEYTF